MTKSQYTDDQIHSMIKNHSIEYNIKLSKKKYNEAFNLIKSCTPRELVKRGRDIASSDKEYREMLENVINNNKDLIYCNVGSLSLKELENIIIKNIEEARAHDDYMIIQVKDAIKQKKGDKK